MSSVFGDSGGAASQQYFCYQCERIINIAPSSEITCPNCQGGFLEEYQPPSNPSDPNNPPNTNPLFSDDFSSSTVFGGGLPFMIPGAGGGAGTGGGGGGGPEIDLFNLLGGASSFGGSAPNPNAFNPMAFLSHYFNNMRAAGADIQFVFEGGEGGGGGAGGAGMTGNFGDYFFGAGLEQLIQQLAENDPNRYGTPPASKSAIEGLPDINITEELLASDSFQCAVCKDSFQLSEVAKQIPCKHIYHKDCILPWLELHNSCPVCRYELPTDDQDYENTKNEQQQSGNQSNSTTNVGGNQRPAVNAGNNRQMPRTVERRVTISFPQWNLRSGSSAEGSNSGAGAGENPNDGGGSGSDGSGQQNSGSGGGPPRYNDVD